MASPSNREGWLIGPVGLFIAFALIMLAGALFCTDTVAREALILDGICRQIAANTTEGRQALVSSVWYPPLPVLLRLPVALVLPIRELPAASLIVSALFGAACLSLLLRMLERWGLGRSRYLFAAALFLDPAFLGEALLGTATTSALFFILLTAYGFAGWVATRSLRSLAYFAFASALLLVTRFELAPWIATAFLLLAGDLAARPAAPGQRRAALILALLPAAYALGLWTMMNWLIMGDALYFVRSLGVVSTQIGLHPLPHGLLPVHLAAAAVCAAAALAGLALNLRSVMYHGILGAGLLAAACVLHARGWFWNAAPILTALPVMSALSIAGLACGTGRKPIRRQSVAAIVPAALLVWSLELHRGRFGRDGEIGADASAGGTGLAARVAHYVRARSEFAKVFVCGYEGFVVRADPDTGVLVPALDFNFHKALADYPGHALYVLVHRPEGRSAADSFHRKYPGLFATGGEWTLHAGDYGQWQLYEIIQAPVRRPPLP